jgi:hypothetical protein
MVPPDNAGQSVPALSDAGAWLIWQPLRSRGARWKRSAAPSSYPPPSAAGPPRSSGRSFLGRYHLLGRLESLRLIDVIDGSPTPNAELLLRLYRRAGHRLEVIAHTATVCQLKGTRGDTGEEMLASFTVQDALTAGLIDEVDEDGRAIARSRNGFPMPWQPHTADLLWARAVSRLVRRLAPDALDRADSTA